MMFVHPQSRHLGRIRDHRPANSGPDGNGVTVAVETPSTGKVTVTIPASNAVGGRLFSRIRAEKP